MQSCNHFEGKAQDNHIKKKLDNLHHQEPDIIVEAVPLYKRVPKPPHWNAIEETTDYTHEHPNKASYANNHGRCSKAGHSEQAAIEEDDGEFDQRNCKGIDRTNHVFCLCER